MPSLAGQTAPDFNPLLLQEKVLKALIKNHPDYNLVRLDSLLFITIYTVNVGIPISISQNSVETISFAISIIVAILADISQYSLQVCIFVSIKVSISCFTALPFWNHEKCVMQKLLVLGKLKEQ